MKYLRAIAITAFMLSVFSAPCFALATGGSVAPRPRKQIQDINYSRATGRMNGAFWGLAFGDVDGDGKKETLLLKRDSVKIGHLLEKGFDDAGSCDLPGLAVGARIYSLDLDGDLKDEIVVSGAREGLPNSVVLGFENGRCAVIADGIIWSLRVLNGKMLGQGYSSDDFFSGSIFEVKFENGKFKKSGRVDVKKNADIYQFAEIPAGEAGDTGIVMARGGSPLEYHERSGKKFRRVWRTGERFGGAVNLLPASQRDVLGQEESATTGFDVPPIVLKRDGGCQLIAVRHDMPLRGVIGLRPAVSGAELVFFTPDSVLVLNEFGRTVKLPGAVTDMAIGEAPGGMVKLFVLLQNNPSMFHEAGSTTILVFDLP